MGSDLICRGVSLWTPHLLDFADQSGAPTEGRPYKSGRAEAQKKVAQTAGPALPATAPTFRFSRISMLNI